jgi:hypothetical protein
MRTGWESGRIDLYYPEPEPLTSNSGSTHTLSYKQGIADFSVTPSATTSESVVDHIIVNCPAAAKYLLPGTHPHTSSHSAKREPGHLPRPPNAFILYRSFFCAQGVHDESKHNILSARAAERWRQLSYNERQPFLRAAQLVRERHASIFPEYKYVPSGGKKSKSKGKYNTFVQPKSLEVVCETSVLNSNCLEDTTHNADRKLTPSRIDVKEASVPSSRNVFPMTVRSESTSDFITYDSVVPLKRPSSVMLSDDLNKVRCLIVIYKCRD